MIVYYIADSNGECEYYYSKKKNFDKHMRQIRSEMEKDPSFNENWTEDGDIWETNSRTIVSDTIHTSD